MAESKRSCEHCGAELAGSSFFCSACGGSVQPVVGAGDHKRTQLGMVATPEMLARAAELQPQAPPKVGAAAESAAGAKVAEASAAPQSSAAAAPELGQAGRTVMGLPRVVRLSKSDLSEVETAPVGGAGGGAGAGTSAPRAAGAAGGTVMGLPGAAGGVDAEGRPSGLLGVAPSNPAPRSEPPRPKRTLFGVASSSSKAVAADAGSDARAAGVTTAAVTSQEPAGGTADSAPSVGANGAGGSGGTSSAKAKAAPIRGATMIGGVGGPLPGARSSERAPARVAAVATEPIELPRRRGSGAWLLVVAVVAGAVAIGAALFLRPSAPAIAARVVTTPDGEALELQLAEAEAGTRVRFGEVERELQAGMARFALPADSLQVGKNAVDVVLLRPGRDAVDSRILLEIDSRVSVDTSALQRGEPTLEVVVVARPGSKVQLDGKPLELDAEGRGRRSDSLAVEVAADDGPGPVRAPEPIEHHVAYHVTSPGGVVQQGELRTPVPVVALRLERPGRSFVTDGEAVEVAGRVGDGVSVRVGEQDVAVTEGRFVHRVALAEFGAHELELFASASGQAPQTVALHFERVADLKAAAAAYGADDSIAYEALAADVEAHRGHRMAFKGRIVDSAVEDGYSQIQLLAKRCPPATRCLLWATYGAPIELKKGSWVELLGTVDGTQEYRAGDEKHSAPRIRAAFLLPTRPW
ncbi:MAG: zinc ribbon domain-containing protein [Myxococcales bacterium]|nr:zinc ribbon domain-containing protein [Myxococcales bacterium]